MLTIKNNKRTYTTKEYEIVFEKVENLGMFLEVECNNFEEGNVKEKKKEIQNFIDSLGIKVSEELNMGKPEMMLKKMNGKNKKIDY